MLAADSGYTITEMEWERALLHLAVETEQTGTVQFYLERVQRRDLERLQDIRLAKAAERIPLKDFREERTAKGIMYVFCWNLTTMKGRSFLENGLWRLIVCPGDGQEQVCRVTTALAYRFEELGRIFRYGKDACAYTVSFETSTIEEKELAFVMNSLFMTASNGWRKRHYVQEVTGWKNKIKRIAMTAALAGVRLFYRLAAAIRPKKGNRLLLMSETHDYLWGNLKAIDEGLKARGLDQTWKISYSFRTAAGKRQSIQSWLRLLWLLAGQDVIFIDSYAPVFSLLHLNKKTKLIQVWHAGLGFKSVGFCRFGKDGSPYPEESCHKAYDYALACSPQTVEVFSEVFGIEKDAFWPVGMPRLDGFLDPERMKFFRSNFYNRYPALQGRQIILFAPTYRGTGQKGAYYDYSWLDLQQIYDFCGNDHIFIVKMHPFVRKAIEIPAAYADRIMDLSDYPDINDLYYITDLLITDYSSNYFDYALLHRPCLFFTPDREIYEISRGVHRSVRDGAPGKVCDTFEELMQALYTGDFEEEKMEAFVKENFDSYDGHATDKVIEHFLKLF